MRKRKYFKPIDGGGIRTGDGTDTGTFHLSELSDDVRIQLNANDTIYIKDIRTIRKITKWLNHAADCLAYNRKHKL